MEGKERQKERDREREREKEIIRVGGTRSLKYCNRFFLCNESSLCCKLMFFPRLFLLRSWIFGRLGVPIRQRARKTAQEPQFHHWPTTKTSATCLHTSAVSFRVTCVGNRVTWRRQFARKFTNGTPGYERCRFTDRDGAGGGGSRGHVQRRLVVPRYPRPHPQRRPQGLNSLQSPQTLRQE